MKNEQMKDEQMKTCPRCGKEFEAIGKQIFCCQNCCHAYHNNKGSKSYKKIESNKHVKTKGTIDDYLKYRENGGKLSYGMYVVARNNNQNIRSG